MLATTSRGTCTTTPGTFLRRTGTLMWIAGGAESISAQQ